MSERESVSSVMAAWAQVVSALVGVVAAGAAYFVGVQSIEQGNKQRDEARTQQTLQFFATFNSPDMLETREKLDNEDWCARYDYLVPPPPNYVSQVTSAQVVSIVDFFDLVNQSCPPSDEMRNEEGLCNREFAEDLFAPYAEDFYAPLSKAILELRGRRGEAFGHGIAVFAGEQAPIADVVEAYRQRNC